MTFIAAICLTAAASHAGDLREVRMELNSKDGIFSTGETAVVKACSAKGAEGVYRMRVLRNGTLITDAQVKLGRKPRTVFEYPCKATEGLMVFIEKGDDNTGVGFAVEPGKFSQGYPCPPDFKAFWDSELAAMRASEPLVKMTEVPVPAEDAEAFVCWALEISMPEGRPVRGYVAMPRGAAAGSLPVVMFLHGAGVVGKSKQASVERAVEHAKFGAGALAADINAHGMMDGQSEQYYVDLEHGDLRNYRIDPPLGRREFYYRLMYLRDVRALDYLCSRPEWDGRHVLITGSSQGGSQTCALAGLDSRVGAIVPVVPGLSDEGAGIVRECGWKRHFRAMTDNPYVRVFYPYYDTANFLRFTSARIWMEVGLIDETVAPEGVFSAFNAAVSADKTIVPCFYRRHSMGTSDKDWERWAEDVLKRRTAFVDGYLCN